LPSKTVHPPQPRHRAAALIEARNLKMARSQHAYVRGSTTRFYEWLEQSSGKLPAGPSIWICGDCHIGNLGPLADQRGRVEIQIRDLDQTVIGNPAHDLIRLGLSLASAARGSDLPGVATAHMLEELTQGYEAALAGDFDAEDGETRGPKAVRGVLRHALKRKWKHLAAERLEDVKPTIPLGKHFWCLTHEERHALEALFAEDAAREMLTLFKGRPGKAEIELVDAAYWMKGCSSLGRLRYAALLRVGADGDGPGELCLVDLKEAAAAAAPRDPEATMPRDNARRVVAGARALSPNLGDRMLALRLLDKAVVMRELTPQDLKIEIDRLTRREAMSVARYLAGVVGTAHGRQMDAEMRASWLAELSRARGKGLDAPSWLWSSVVELVAAHEAAYLDHCRKVAMAEAA
jgi:uncharacterized protein (DUF2252 family)